MSGEVTKLSDLRVGMCLEGNHRDFNYKDRVCVEAIGYDWAVVRTTDTFGDDRSVFMIEPRDLPINLWVLLEENNG